MHFKNRDFPWDHMVVESIWAPEDFHIVRDAVASWPKTPSDKRRLSMFILDHERDGYICAPKVYQMLENRFKLLLDSYDPRDTKMIFEYNTCPAGYTYPMHEDAPEKIASFVIYVAGEGAGTSLYTRDKRYACDVDFVPNTGMFFLRDDDTWHSYRSTADHRDTINCILVKNDKQLLKNLRYDVDV